MENKAQVGLGEYLRGEREKRHITIEQVASATKINIKLLHALEGDNYDSLPAKPFVRGFVTSYTRYVGLDHREVLARFDLFLDEKSGLKFKRPENAPHIFVEREGQGDNSKTALTVAMVGFLVIAVVAFALLKPLKHRRGRGKDKTVVTNEEVITVVPPPSEGSPITAKPLPTAKKPDGEAAPSTAETSEAPKVEAKAEPKPEPKPESKPEPKVEAKAEPKPAKPEAPAEKAEKAPKPAASPAVAGAPVKIPPIPANEVKHRLVVRATEDAWVKYQVDDRPVQQYTLRKDKVIFVRARNNLRFTTAKPSAIEISFDNKEFRPFGSSAKTIILPKDAEGQFKANPFVDPNPAYLSTPNH